MQLAMIYFISFCQKSPRNTAYISYSCHLDVSEDNELNDVIGLNVFIIEYTRIAKFDWDDVLVWMTDMQLASTW